MGKRLRPLTIQPAITMKNTKPNATNTTVFCIAWLGVILWLCASATACAQSSATEYSIAYEAALLDSLHRYEKLKPAYASLQKAHASQREEITALRGSLRILQLYQDVQEQEHQNRIQLCHQNLKRARIWGNVKTVTALALISLIVIKP